MSNQTKPQIPDYQVASAVPDLPNTAPISSMNSDKVAVFTKGHYAFDQMVPRSTSMKIDMMTLEGIRFDAPKFRFVPGNIWYR